MVSLTFGKGALWKICSRSAAASSRMQWLYRSAVTAPAEHKWKARWKALMPLGCAECPWVTSTKGDTKHRTWQASQRNRDLEGTGDWSWCWWAKSRGHNSDGSQVYPLSQPPSQVNLAPVTIAAVGLVLPAQKDSNAQHPPLYSIGLKRNQWGLLYRYTFVAAAIW